MENYFMQTQFLESWGGGILELQRKKRKKGVFLIF